MAYILRMRLIPLRNLGHVSPPDNAWQAIQGIETLPFEWKDIHQMDLKLLSFYKIILKLNGYVIHRSHDNSYELAQKYMPKGSEEWLYSE